jgi:hypothetical protein
MLLDTYSYSDDAPLESGFTYTPRHEAQDARGHVLQRLASDGYAEDLDALRHGRPDLDQRVIANYQRTARARQADLALRPTSPQTVKELLRRADARLVRDDADLMHVVLDQLAELQHSVRHNDAFREIWSNDSPHSEDDISDWLRRRFDERLQGGLIVDREIQVARPKGKGIGTRVDLTATARTMSGDVARIIVEAKRIDNAELMTAMRQQLIERYLVPSGRTHGIYLAYWVAPEQRPARWSRTRPADMETLRDKLSAQADQARDDGFVIKPYILDISRPKFA